MKIGHNIQHSLYVIGWLYLQGLLYKSIQAQTPAHYANVNISNMAMRNAALWATLAQQVRSKCSYNELWRKKKAKAIAKAKLYYKIPHAASACV